MLKLLEFVQFSKFSDDTKLKQTDRLLDDCESERMKLDLIALFIAKCHMYLKKVDPHITEVGFEIVKNIVKKGFNREELLNLNLSAVLTRYLKSSTDESEKENWCEILFTAVSENKIIGPLSSLYLIRDTAMCLPNKFLNYVFDDNYINNETRNKILEFSQVSGSILSEIEPKILLEWCKQKNDPQIWETIAAGIKCLDHTENHEIFKFSQQAKDFLEVCPNSQEVLNCFAKSIYPQSYSGRISDEMEYRLNAFRGLEITTNSNILDLVKNLIQEQTTLILQQRESENVS